MLEILGITADNLASINDVPYSALLAAAVEAGLEYGPMIDGDYYPAKEWVNGEETGISKDIPVMASQSFAEFTDNFAMQMLGMYDGFNSTTLTDEKVMETLNARYGENAQAVADEFKKAYPDMPLMNVLFINDHNGMLPRTDAVANIRAKNGGAPVYQVIYAMGYPIFDGVSNIHTGGDLPYLFNNIDKIDILIAGNEVNAQKMADQASTYLCNFARTGDPNGEGLPVWPAYDLESGYTMILNENSEARSFHDTKLMELLDQRIDQQK